MRRNTRKRRRLPPAAEYPLAALGFAAAVFGLPALGELICRAVGVG